MGLSARWLLSRPKANCRMTDGTRRAFMSLVHRHADFPTADQRNMSATKPQARGRAYWPGPVLVAGDTSRGGRRLTHED
jgi:hypothetical protein